jgi:hypothetical protein
MTSRFQRTRAAAIAAAAIVLGAALPTASASASSTPQRRPVAPEHAIAAATPTPRSNPDAELSCEPVIEIVVDEDTGDEVGAYDWENGISVPIDGDAATCTA